MNTSTRSFNNWQTRTIIYTMVGYALFYFVRKNFSIAMPGLTAEFGISKVSLGLFLTLHGIIYGLSRFVNGIVSDRGSAKVVASVGLLLCAVANIIFGVSDFVANWIVVLAAKMGTTLTFSSVLVYCMGIVWVINGYLQGMGVPPFTKINTHWIHPDQLATKMSVWNMSHSIGAGLVFGLCGWVIMPYLGLDMSANAEVVETITTNLGASASYDEILSFAQHFGAWRLCFLIPAAFALLGSLGIITLIKNSPSEVGLPEVVEKKAQSVKSEAEKAEYNAFVRRRYSVTALFGHSLLPTSLSMLFVLQHSTGAQQCLQSLRV